MTAVIGIIGGNDGNGHNGDTLYLIHGHQITKFNITTGKSEKIHTHSSLLSPATCFLAGADGDDQILILDTNKQLALIDTQGKVVKDQLFIEKNALCSTTHKTGGDERNKGRNTVYIGDKFGDIIKVDPEEWTQTLVAGCCSMVTGILCTSTHLIYTDRDEKVRVLNREKPFIIDEFLLEHGACVVDCCLVGGGDGGAGDDCFVSLDGDGLLCCWKYCVASDADEKKWSLQYSRQNSKDKNAFLLSANEHGSMAIAHHTPSKLHFYANARDPLSEDKVVSIEMAPTEQITCIRMLKDHLIVASIKNDDDEEVDGKRGKVCVSVYEIDGDTKQLLNTAPLHTTSIADDGGKVDWNLLHKKQFHKHQIAYQEDLNRDKKKREMVGRD